MQDVLPPERSGERSSPARVIRRRLIAVLVAEFAILMGVSAVQGFWPNGVGREGALLVLFGVGLTLPVGMALLARQLLDDVEGLASERDELREMYGRARLDSLRDPLTGLGNHRAFQEELARQIEQARRHPSPLALLIVDVDDLKKANDERGHEAGDELLIGFGRIARAVLRRADRAFRVGGDEFAILLPQSDIETGLVVGRRMLASALEGGDPSQPVSPFSVSIGVSAFPVPSVEGTHLYRHADAALYWCKRHGRTAVVAYDAGRHGSALEERAIEELSADVGKTIARRALRAVYQPIFSLETGAPIGYEGLVRPGDDSPFQNASSLFAAAEAADRIVELDMVCLQVVADGTAHLEDGVYLSVNLSPRTVESDLFRTAELAAIFRRRGIEPHQIVLELTEREEVEDLEQLRSNVDACRRAGFRIAADDVGAGNAGLRLLSEVPFDMLKVDLSLVQGGVLNDPSYAVLRALQELATQRRASIVAEGVETAEQLAVIRDIGFGAAQGYLLGRPTSARVTDRLDLAALSGATWVDVTDVDEPAA
ncbi:MAG TPA: EAL domain-containing protein [Candidatus Limnocylindrales bacterium]|nr:EAL domain-containing protein [Candidatus Limnocylindrales bacterium]